MKLMVYIHGIFPEQVGAAHFRELLRIFPEGKQLRSFECDLPMDDPRVSKIERVLRAAGKKPWLNGFKEVQPDEYNRNVYREYERNDFDDLELVAFSASEHVDGLFRDERGRIKLIRQKMKPLLDVAYPRRGSIVVPDRVKKIIEKWKPKRLVFKPTVLKSGLVYGKQVTVAWKDYGERWWEMTSDLILPPLAPSVTLVDENGVRIKGQDFSNGCYSLDEELGCGAELAYMRSSLKSVGAFDLALTHENWGAKGSTDSRSMVASKRFYDLWKEHRLRNAQWWPVREVAGRANRTVRRK